MLTIHKENFFWENLLENKEMFFNNGVKSLQAAGYDGEGEVSISPHCVTIVKAYFVTGDARCIYPK